MFFFDLMPSLYSAILTASKHFSNKFAQTCSIAALKSHQINQNIILAEHRDWKPSMLLDVCALHWMIHVLQNVRHINHPAFYKNKIPLLD